MDSRLFALALAVLVVPMSGCFGGSKVSSIDLPPPDTDALPTGTDTKSIVKVDKNVTTIGSQHFHNYWGDSPVDTPHAILDRDIATGPGGVCVGTIIWGCDVGGEEARFVRFQSSDDEKEAPNNVWPGTGKMTIEIRIDGQVLAPFRVAVSAPNRPGWSKEFYKVDRPTMTITIPNILENHTDAPHNRESQWVFRIESDTLAPPARASLYEGTMHWKVTIYRADRPLPLDPAHPDYWGDKVHIDALDTSFFQEATMVNGGTYGSLKYTRAAFPKNTTVFPLTKTMTVQLSWTNNHTGQPPLELLYCTASQDCDSTGAIFEPASPIRSRADERVYELSLRSDMWDSPYATTSGWRFLWRFDNGDLSETAGSTGAFDGTIRWVVALDKIV